MLRIKCLLKIILFYRFLKKVIKEGAYPNMRMLRNDIEDAINFEILKVRALFNN